MKINKIRSYVPESEHLSQKMGHGARVCLEDCAVVDVGRGGVILAARGAGFSGGTVFDATGMSKEERGYFDLGISRHTRFLLSVGERPLLIFTDWLAQTGLVLAVLLHCDAMSAATALEVLPDTGFACLMAREGKGMDTDACRDAFECLSDVFSYTDVIFSPSADTVIRLSHIAAFAGCRLQPSLVKSVCEGGLRVQNPHTVLFLLCAFLFLRGQDGMIDADGEDAPLYRITLGENMNKTPSASPTFAETPCFGDCKTETDGVNLTLTFDAREEELLHAPVSVPMTVTVLIERVFETELHPISSEVSV